MRLASLSEHDFPGIHPLEHLLEKVVIFPSHSKRVPGVTVRLDREEANLKPSDLLVTQSLTKYQRLSVTRRLMHLPHTPVATLRNVWSPLRSRLCSCRGDGSKPVV